MLWKWLIHPLNTEGQMLTLCLTFLLRSLWCFSGLGHTLGYSDVAAGDEDTPSLHIVHPVNG